MKKVFSAVLSLLLFFNITFAQTPEQADEKPDLEKILSDFDAYATKTRRDWNIPGMSICIVVGDEVVYKKAFGVKEVKTDNNVDTQTIFQIASCTKAFTSALVAILVDKGFLKWDDKVIQYLPDFRLYNKEVSDNITIEDLLAQYSGLPSYSQHLMMLFEYDTKYIIESMRYIKPVNGFREKYSYQNNLYLLLGEVIRKATGKSWNKNMEEHIFAPLGMYASTTDYKSYLKSKNRSIGHYYSGGRLTPIPDELPYNNWPYVFAPASGINSNIDDMAKWLLFLINDANAYGVPLITPDNFNKMFETQVFINTSAHDRTKKNYYCLGWRCAEYEPENIFWHAGTTDGEGAYVCFMKDKKIGMVILMNLPNGRMADALSKRFFDAYLQNPEINWSAVKLKEAEKAYQRKTPKVPPQVVVPPLDLKKYVGKYENILYGVTEVKLENGKLKFSAGAKKVWITLKHFSGNSFDGVGVPGWTFKRPMFIFRVYENSNVNGLVVENMTDGVETIFRKIK